MTYNVQHSTKLNDVCKPSNNGALFYLEAQPPFLLKDNGVNYTISSRQLVTTAILPSLEQAMGTEATDIPTTTIEINLLEEYVLACIRRDEELNAVLIQVYWWYILPTYAHTHTHTHAHTHTHTHTHTLSHTHSHSHTHTHSHSHVHTQIEKSGDRSNIAALMILNDLLNPNTAGNVNLMAAAYLLSAIVNGFGSQTVDPTISEVFITLCDKACLQLDNTCTMHTQNMQMSTVGFISCQSIVRNCSKQGGKWSKC